MITLVEPSEKYLESYMEACREHRANGVQGYPFYDAETQDIFEKYENFRSERNLPPGWVGAHYYWLVDTDKAEFIGEISIRHRLTGSLKRYGGHIGYGVRFSRWNQGYGTRMLRLALEKAKELGISRVLITCDDDNYASAKVMEHNGLTLQDKVTNTIDGRTIITRRYTKTL